MSKNLKVLMFSDICGKSSGYHVGDEAMAEVAVARLKKICGTENITLACASPKAVTATYGVPSFAYYNFTDTQHADLKIHRPLSYLKSTAVLQYQLRKHDVLFICGGGNLTSEWPGVLESRMRLIQAALKLNKKVVLVSQTLGPYSPEHRRKYAHLLPQLDWVGVRDKHYSHKQTEATVKYAIDDASFLKPEHSARTSKVASGQKPYMTFSMRKFGDANDSLLDILSQEVAKINTNKGVNTVFIPHHSPNGGGDTALINQRSHYFQSDLDLTIVDPIELAAPLKALTSEGSWTVSMRYHQIVFALSTGVPVVGIYVNEYTQAKLRGAFEQFGLEPKLLAIDEVNGKLEPLIEQAISEKSLFHSAAEKCATDSLTDSMKPYRLVESWAS